MKKTNPSSDHRRHHRLQKDRQRSGSGITGEELADRLPHLKNAYDITVRDILHPDFSNIQPEEWRFIARSVFEAKDAYDGIVITHDTDTMAYTASVLSFMLPIEHPLLLAG